MERTSAPKALGGEVLPPGAEPLQADDPPVIEGHRLTGRLASGGTSVVYLAHDPNGRHVVVKTTRMRKADQTQARRWLRTEAASVRRLPAFCTPALLVDGSDESPPYLIRDYVEGPSLAQFVEGLGPLEAEQIGALAVALARALEAVHGAGLIHCDLEPTNVLLAADGPRLIDFSIAQEAPLAGRPAEVGTVPYNPGWVSPERVDGHPAGPASDVFGWGCLLGYAATGRSAFDGDEAGEGRWSVARASALEALEEPVRELVEAALAVDPADRPSTGDLIARLDGPPARETPVPRPLARRDDPVPAHGRTEFTVDEPTAPMPAVMPEPPGPARAPSAPPARLEALPAAAAAGLETGQADDLLPWRRSEPAAAPRHVEYAAEGATAALTASTAAVPAAEPPGQPSRRVDYAAETSGARSRAGWDDEPKRRPRRLRAVAMVTAPAAMVAVLATVIAMAAADNGGPTPVQQGGAVTTPGQGLADSPQAPEDPGHHSYGPRPASAASARDHASPSASGRRHGARTKHGSPSRPGGGQSPGSPPSSRPTPTPTHSPTPSPTPTPTGTGPAHTTGDTSGAPG